jgi:hypothetical protein
VPCPNHPEAPVTSVCAACGTELCAACGVVRLGLKFCDGCRRQLGHDASGGERLKLPWLATLMSMAMPGLGQVYNGFVVRGLAQFAFSFFLLWLVGCDTGLGALLVVALLVTWLWQVLDANAAAKEINRTGRLPDVAEAQALGRVPLARWTAQSRVVAIALIVLGALILLGSVGLAWLVSRVAIPLGLIGLGAWLLWRSRDERRGPGAPPPPPPPPPEGAGPS